MLKVDEFESAFRAADKPSFVLDAPPVRSVLLVDDLQDEAHTSLHADVRNWLERALGDEPSWSAWSASDYGDVYDLVKRLEREPADLVVTYRNLKDDAWRYPYSLGHYLNVLTREVDIPVVVIPNPHEFPEREWKDAGTDSVMVVTDHLAGDAALVNWAVRLSERNAKLLLTHIEDDVVFARYMDTIAKIPGIDTEEARSLIRKQLLQEPHDYVSRCRAAIEAAGLPLQIEEVVRMGHRVHEYEELARQHDVDLLVFHDHEDGNVAMHGAARSLVIAMRHTPIFLL